MKKFFTPLLLILSINASHSQIIINETFDGDVLPAGWTQETVAPDGGWNLGDAHELGSAIFPVLEHGNFIGTNDKCFCDHSNDFLMTPSMNLSTYSNLWLMFDYSYLDFIPQDFTLEISTDGGDSWDIIEHLSFSAGGYYGWWERKYYDISDYAGYDDVMIGFRYSDGGDWWSYGASLDNVKIFQPVSDDISLDSVTVQGNYSVTGTGITLNGVITNFGTNPVNSFTAVWNDGITTSSSLITGIDVPQFATFHFSHDVPYVPAEPIKYTIEFSAIDPNGTVDGIPADNSLNIDLHGCSSKPDKPALAELATGTWCSWCVRGHVYMDSMYFLYPQNFIGIAVHDNDIMEVNEYDSSMYAYQNYLSYEGGAAYPSIIAEHKYYMDPMDMPVKMLPFMNSTVPAAIQVFGSYNDTTGIINVSLKATIVSNLNDIDYRLNLVITEDSVTGEGPAWAQSNAYADGYFGAMGGYELLPDPVPADLMVYDHVARYLADTWHGAEGSIPTDVNDLDTFYRNYEIPVDDDWNTDHLNLIGMILDHTTGQLINAKEVHMHNLVTEPEDTSGTDTTIVEAITDMNSTPSVKLYPNPADAWCTITFSLQHSCQTELVISDIAGKVVAEKEYGELTGDQTLPVNTSMLQQGVYFISVRFGDQTVNKQLTVYH